MSFKVPDGAADCHHHIYDPRFAYNPNAVLKPPFATVADYRELQKKLGTSRNVMVQPSTYGTDNSCVLDVLAQMGDELPRRLRGQFQGHRCGIEKAPRRRRARGAGAVRPGQSGGRR